MAPSSSDNYSTGQSHENRSLTESRQRASHGQIVRPDFRLIRHEMIATGAPVLVSDQRERLWQIPSDSSNWVEGSPSLGWHGETDGI
jgi:hypothetical protein